MSKASILSRINMITRASDWRLSFVPFVMACVYLWIFIFNVSFTLQNLVYFILSITTTFGFAALGYFINEFFDQDDDRKAGKLNKLSLISTGYKIGLLVIICLLCFTPWLYLPSDLKSWGLIFAEISCFILYAAPFPRLKRSKYFAGILDASYAYLLPGLLSFHTYQLISEKHLATSPVLFFVAIFFIGYRNIFLHQIKDILGDQRAGMISLPKYLGIEKSYKFLQILYLIEIAAVLAFSLEFILISKWFFAWLLCLLIYLSYHAKELKKILAHSEYFALLPERHVLDLLYQLWFPLIMLTTLIISNDWKWLIILPFHLILFVNKDFIVKFFGVLSHYLWHQTTRPFLSALVNYPIFILFRLFGVNLKKEGLDAVSYFKRKFK